MIKINFINIDNCYVNVKSIVGKLFGNFLSLDKKEKEKEKRRKIIQKKNGKDHDRCWRKLFVLLKTFKCDHFFIMRFSHKIDTSMARSTYKTDRIKINFLESTIPSSRISLHESAHLHGHKRFKRFDLSTKDDNYFAVKTIL